MPPPPLADSFRSYRIRLGLRASDHHLSSTCDSGFRVSASPQLTLDLGIAERTSLEPDTDDSKIHAEKWKNPEHMVVG